jgi:hypothetical protein
MLTNLRDKRAVEGLSFSGFVNTVASAGNVSVAQLWNPAGTGKLLLVRRMVVSETVGGSGVACVQTSAPAASITGAVPANRVPTGPASVAEFRQQQAATVPAAVAQFFNMLLGANEAIEAIREGPQVVPPGYGLALWSLPNVGVAACFEWEELAA